MGFPPSYHKTSSHLERIPGRAGEERCADRSAEVAAHQAKPLVERKSVPAGVSAPELAVVLVDGGRLQILDRTAAARDNPVSRSQLIMTVGNGPFLA